MKNYVWEKFWRLLVLEEAERGYIKSRPSWFRRLKCICDCWNVWIYYSNSLWRQTSSCWCLHLDRVTKTWILKNRKENGNHPMYNCWSHIIQKCDNKNYHNYHIYWARGISYDPTRKQFENFYEDMKEWREKWLSIDRINNNWNYSKENCRWTTNKVQSRNRRTNVIYKWKCIVEWSEIRGIPKSTAYYKVRKLLSDI